MLDPQVFELSKLTEADIVAFLKRYRNNPVRFSSEVLGIELDDNQRLIAEAVRDYPRVAVVSGRGIGKTVLDGALSIWFWATRPKAEVRLLANTDRQSRDVLWPPMVRAFNGSCIRSWGKPPSTEALFFAGNKMGAAIRRVVWSASSIESVSGVHAEHLLYILDEASKMPNELVESINSGLTQSGNKILLTSNGTRSSGYFYNACNDPKNWHVIHVDSRSSRWTDKAKIEDLIEKYGLGSDVVRVNVLGQFPLTSSASIVSDDQLLGAMKREIEPMREHAVVCGMDVGGGGDASVWAVRKGRKLVAMVSDTSAGGDSDKLIGKTMDVCSRFGVRKLIVDATGLGYFLPERLRKALPEVEVVGVSFAGKPPKPGYENMRTWVYFRLREWFESDPDIGYEGAQELREELLATEYITNAKGNLAIVPKQMIKASLDRSPDHADALALSCGYDGDLNSVGKLTGRERRYNWAAVEKAGKWADAPDWYHPAFSDPLNPRWR